MSILKIHYSHLLLCTVLFFQACSPSEEDVQAMITGEDYQSLYEYIADEVESGSAKLSIYGYEEPTIFEKATLTMLTTSNSWNEEVANLVRKNRRAIANSSSFPVAIWTTILNQENEIPSGLHEYYYTWYESSESSFKGGLKNRVEDRLKTDSGFHSSIRTKRDEILSEENLGVPEYREIFKLSKIINDTEKTAILEKAFSLHQRKEELDDLRRDIDDDKFSLNYETEKKIREAEDQIENITSELEDFEEYQDAYIFSGLMVQRLGSTGFHEVYEVKDYNGTTYILGTSETYFSSRGTFRLRVVDGGRTIVRLKEDYGGFVQGVSIIREVTDKQWNQYNSILNELGHARNLQRTAQNSIKPTGEYDSKIAELETQIEELEGQISNLFGQIK
ncbi:hypothetical protein [Gracilimonas tropica]|uniref:hypothetical protein n=1 Tax=Gracilimonas tropica TaxID=454600 RepID=UPI0012FAA022|nr:hypothetical protein [Gracilimonas tropica]